MTEQHLCPRRKEIGNNLEKTFKVPKYDTWREQNNANGLRTCSWCGSVHPDDLSDLIEKEGLGVLETNTTKPSRRSTIAATYSAHDHLLDDHSHDTRDISLEHRERFLLEDGGEGQLNIYNSSQEIQQPI